MDWIEGYQILDDALYSPSGEKIAHIARTMEGAAVLPVSPELIREFGAGDISAESAEAACQILVMAHAKHLRVVSVQDLREGAANVAQVLVQARADGGSSIQIGDIQTKVGKASPSTLLKFLKGISLGSIGAIASLLDGDD